ncbi:MAG TPA: benenodin family lasso peptide [Sphingomicrobium sp.]|jgi:hypothetical protein
MADENNSDIITDLGAASVATQGGVFGLPEDIGRQLAGIDSED